MTYDLEFHERARAEWGNLDPALKARFKAKLAERLEQPHVPNARIGPNRYKIKIMRPGFRLVYDVQGSVVRVLGVGPRSTVYGTVQPRR